MTIRGKREGSSERDESMDRLLRRAFRTDPASGSPASCLDAETLAAWVDGGLAGSELTTAEAHVAECSRCQATVAVLVTHQPVVPAAESWWPRNWGIGWLIPLTAGAAAVLLWFALPNNQPPSVPERTQVQTQAAAPPAPQEGQLAAPRRPPAAVGDERRAAAETGQRALNQALDKDATSPARRDAQERSAPQTTADRAQAPVDALGKLRDENAVAAPPAAASPAAARAAESAAPVAAPRSALGRLVAGAPAEITSPDPSIRWRIGAAGSIQYSSNGGSTWEALSTGVVADLTAGASPLPSVCWVVGRAGTVLLTTDGRRWLRLTFPEEVDLVAVEATDARVATVTTADGRKLRTADGGATWNSPPLGT